MAIFNKYVLIVVVFLTTVTAVFADRGGTVKKSKSKTTLNIVTHSSIRNSIGFNLKSGLSYKGSLLVNRSPMMSTSITTYQKGNTIYIVPQKQRIIIPEMRQGYTGLKIIIKSKK
jgi:hypothetical protein